MTAIRLAGGVIIAAGLVLSAGCSGGATGTAFRDPAVPAGSFQLVSFTSCDDALHRLKEAAKQYVGPYGFGGGGALKGGGVARRAEGAAPPGAADMAGAPAPGAPGTGSRESAPNYSGTNTHEAGVDEPDLVKTDGRRILTDNQGVLRVIDAATRRVSGELNLRRTATDPVRWGGADLLLHGDRALVLVSGDYSGWRGGPGVAEDAPGKPFAPPQPGEIAGPRLLLVDLAGAPRLLGSYTMDGSLVDARQVGSVIRVVLRSAPRLAFDYGGDRNDAERIAANRAVIDKAGPDEWLPRYAVEEGGRTTTGRVGCDAVSRPAQYSGTSMVTVLTFDLSQASLASGDPVTVVADGDTVYSNGPSLYVANDQRWRAVPMDTRAGGAKPVQPEERTELYKFDTSGSGRPQHVASGSVPGWLINQYALSEWDGHLRVATTTGQAWDRSARSSSAVYVLAQRGRSLVETGKVTGLGKGERIYAVRFAGPVGYVVTFRQTDPLYTVDLTNPKAPRTVGELKITGYSAYLHPAGDGRLIGIGQEANQQGRIQGTQVSLFDVSDLAKPTRLAQYHARYGHSEAEFDPHAFLYWAQNGLLVVPLNVYSGQSGGGGALVLQVSGARITEVGLVSHAGGQIRRSLMIDDVLWTVSEAGAKATDARTLATLAWLPFD